MMGVMAGVTPYGCCCHVKHLLRWREAVVLMSQRGPLCVVTTMSPTVANVIAHDGADVLALMLDVDDSGSTPPTVIYWMWLRFGVPCSIVHSLISPLHEQVPTLLAWLDANPTCALHSLVCTIPFDEYRTWGDVWRTSRRIYSLSVASSVSQLSKMMHHSLSVLLYSFRCAPTQTVQYRRLIRHAHVAFFYRHRDDASYDVIKDVERLLPGATYHHALVPHGRLWRFLLRFRAVEACVVARGVVFDSVRHQFHIGRYR